jgi:hypothetical protein
LKLLLSYFFYSQILTRSYCWLMMGSLATYIIIGNSVSNYWIILLKHFIYVHCTNGFWTIFLLVFDIIREKL